MEKRLLQGSWSIQMAFLSDLPLELRMQIVVVQFIELELCPAKNSHGCQMCREHTRCLKKLNA